MTQNNTTDSSQPLPDENTSMRLGDLLVSEGLVSNEDIERTLRVQEKLERHKRLGEIIVELGFISKTDLQQIIKKYKKNIRIGDLLVEKNLLSPDQLQEALAAQKENPSLKLGEYLVSEGIINERHFMHALSEQLDLPYIEPDIFLVDKNLFRGLSLEYLKQMLMVPFARDSESGQTTVITYDPLDSAVRRAVEEVFPLKAVSKPLNSHRR